MYNILLWRMRISQNLDFFLNFFFCRTVPIFFLAALLFVFLCFLLLSYSLYLLPETHKGLHCTSFLLIWKVSIFSNEKLWKGDHDQVQVYWPVLPPILHQKLITFFSISSLRLQSIVKMDSPVERSIQPLLVACPKNLLTCKFVTSQVVEWTFLQIPEESGLSILRVKGFHSLLRRHSFGLSRNCVASQKDVCVGG